MQREGEETEGRSTEWEGSSREERRRVEFGTREGEAIERGSIVERE